MLNEHIVKRGGKYVVVNKNRTKTLSKPSSRAKALKRLRQIEYFKHHHEEVTPMEETLVESVSIDLKRLSGIEFKKKYNKSKFDMRRQIASQPIARKHFGYAPTGNMGGKWDASTSSKGNPARKDKVSGARKALVNRQPNARLHKRSGVGGQKFGSGSIMSGYNHLMAVGLDEFGVQTLSELNDQDAKLLIQAVEQQLEFVDTDGNSYGPFWTEEKTWKNAQGYLEGKCVGCGDLASTHPDASHPLNYCGDCNGVVGSECATKDSATRCPSCAKKYNAKAK